MVHAIIQARYGSSRLKGKVLVSVCGVPVMGHIINRVKRAHLVDAVIVATSNSRQDDPVADLAVKLNTPVFRGSEDDVLDRFYNAAKKFGCSTIVRLTADCPLIDPDLIDQCIRCYCKNGNDYVSNSYPSATYPDGLDVEVFSIDALECAWKNAKLPSEREHVTPYIWNNREGRFSIYNIKNKINLSGKRWTLDTAEDLQFIASIYQCLYRENNCFGMEDILQLLEQYPSLEHCNKGILRNEGYHRSLQQDREESGKMPDGLKIATSLKFFERAKKVIPSCTQTLSKGYTQFPFGVSPVYAKRAEGCHIWDVDGNRYIDWPMALGPVIFGYNYRPVCDAVMMQIREGVTFSLPHYKEVELAERLCSIIPCAEMVRFGKNGSDATAGAVRAARAYTGRAVVACCGYHGWQDWYIGTTSRNLGVPASVSQDTKIFQYNNIESLERLFQRYHKKIACVIMEPTGFSEPQNDFLEKVNDLAHKNGALVIYDECWTGFRWAMGGAQEFYQVSPDLVCLGKALGNGFPISVVAGKREVMQIFNDIFYSFTFGGDMIGIAAALCVVDELEKTRAISHIWSLGRMLFDGISKNIRKHEFGQYVHLAGAPPRIFVLFKKESGDEDLLLKSVVQQEMIRRGLLYAGYHVLTYSHTQAEIERTIEAYDEIFSLLHGNVSPERLRDLLKGECVQPVFRTQI